MAPPANVSVTKTLVRPTFPVFAIVTVYSMISPAVSTTESSALVSVLVIVKEGLGLKNSIRVGSELFVGTVSPSGVSGTKPS